MPSFNVDVDTQARRRYRINSFSVPAAVRTDFDAAMQRNLAFIETLPGFLDHVVFEKTDGPSHFNIVTIAVWESAKAIEQAVVAVRQYYERIGFNPGEANARWGVAAEIGQYDALESHRARAV